MAARTRKERHDDFTREKIRTTQLVNRLQNHALAKPNAKGELPVGQRLQQTQLRAIEILLRKSLPDLSNVQVSGADGGLPIRIIVEGKDASLL